MKDKYQIFCAGTSNLPAAELDLYKGDTTNLFYYKKHQIDAVLVEISSKFRSSKMENSKELGQKLSQDLGDFFSKLDGEIRNGMF
ncbi:MAG: hypothetical protein WCK59_04515 [Candidatus Falkowbacteria bacterium]